MATPATYRKFFVDEPTLAWTKVLCPICGEPTGPKSLCYKNPPENLPANKRKLLSKQVIMPIYSYNCVYRQDNVWEANTNYPVSNPLLRTLKNIKGVERIIPVKTHVFHLIIGKLFDEKIVKQEINLAYRTFIKELQALESSLSKDSDILDRVKYCGLVFPNGKTWKAGKLKSDEVSDQNRILTKILASMPDVKGITLDAQIIPDGSLDNVSRDKKGL